MKYSPNVNWLRQELLLCHGLKHRPFCLFFGWKNTALLINDFSTESTTRKASSGLDNTQYFIKNFSTDHTEVFSHNEAPLIEDKKNLFLTAPDWNSNTQTILASFDNPTLKDPIKTTLNLTTNPLFVFKSEDATNPELRSALRTLSGVYAWYNTSELAYRVVYVGGALVMGARPFKHLEPFPLNSNIRLTNALNKYGVHEFVLLILQAVESKTLPLVRKEAKDMVNDMETFFLSSIPKDRMYNFLYVAGSNENTESTPETIEKISGSNNHASLAVTLIHIKTNVVSTFETITEACLFVKCSRSTFLRAQNGSKILKHDWLILDVQVPKAPLPII